MIPKGSEAVSHLAARVLGGLAEAPDAYAAADLMMMAQLIAMVGQDYDRAADVYVADHHDICAIIKTLDPKALAPDLMGRLEAVLTSEPPSLRVSVLAERADIEMKALIDLHASVEDAQATGASWARQVNLKIWRFLDETVKRRSYQSAL